MAMRGLSAVLASLVCVLGLQVRAADSAQLFVTATAWNSEGDKLAIVGIRQTTVEGYLQIINTVSETEEYRFSAGSTGFSSVAWSPDSRYLAVGSYDQTVWIFDVENEQHLHTLVGHRSTVSAIDWSNDGTRLISAGNWDGKLILWDTMTFEVLQDLQTGDPWDIEFSPDDTQIAVATGLGLFVFPSSLDFGGFQQQQQYRHNETNTGSVTWDTLGERIAFGTVTLDSEMTTLNISDAQTGSIQASYRTDDLAIYGLDWSADGALIAVYNTEGSVKIWDVESGLLSDLYSGNLTTAPQKLAFSPFGGRLAYGLTVSAEQAARSTTLADSGIAIVVPAPSLERLNRIAQGCISEAGQRGLTAANQIDQLPDYIAQVEALSDEQVSPGCRADVLAVARALDEQWEGDSIRFQFPPVPTGTPQPAPYWSPLIGPCVTAAPYEFSPPSGPPFSFQQNPCAFPDWEGSEQGRINEITEGGADMFLNWVYWERSIEAGTTPTAFQNKLWRDSGCYPNGCNDPNNSGLARSSWMDSTVMPNMAATQGW